MIFKLMNILVTGGCGFIGSNFLNYMVMKYPNYKFINIDAMYYCASHSNIHEKVKTSQNYKFIEGNINDLNLIKYIMTEEKITHVVHFAAQSHVDTSFTNSLQYTLDNVKGTHTLLEAIRIINLNIIFLHFSTDEVYGESNMNEGPKNEMQLLCPTNPYAASKAGAEMLVNSYIYSYKLKSIISRCNNVYGPNQYEEKLIPRFIKLLKSGKKCSIHGDGSALRSFIHVYDVSTAVDILLHKGVIGEIYNIGSNVEDEKSVLDITNQIIDIMKHKKWWPHHSHGQHDMNCKYYEYVKDRPWNDKRYFITNEKIKLLGWNQSILFAKGLRDLIDAYST